MVTAVAKNPLGQTELGLIPVAQYVRMSTEHQRYSTENQGLAIQEYADSHGMQIVKTYADAGKSGLNTVRQTFNLPSSKPTLKACWKISMW